MIGNSVLWWWSNPCEIPSSEGVGTYSSSTISRSGLEETELVGFVVSRFVKLVKTPVIQHMAKELPCFNGYVHFLNGGCAWIVLFAVSEKPDNLQSSAMVW